MTRSLLVCAVLGAVAVAPGAHAAAPSAFSADCGARSETFLFWPQGHGAIAGAGFPEYRTPHLEIYKGVAGKFPDSATHGYAEPKGGSAAKTCKIATARKVKAKVKSAKRTRQAKQIRCKFGKKVTFEFSKVSNGTRVRAALPDGQVAIDLKILSSGSSATYNRKLCKAVAPPK